MTTAVLSSKQRIASIDVLRGLVMIVMALDHTRDFFHIHAITADPTDLATTTSVLFFTRWITHFCAPVFVFLAGTSVFMASRYKTKKEVSALLWKRGLWLMFFEVVIFNPLFSFDPAYHFIGLQVIWVTGLSMVLLAALIRLPVRVIFITGLVMVAGHNALDVFNSSDRSQTHLIWGFFHQPFFKPYGHGRMFAVLYPLIPWPGVLFLGYAMGTWFAPSYEAVKRRKKLLLTGLFVTAAFFVIRWINIYGDNSPWTAQKNTTTTILSFFNVTKYPPSLLYLCMTLGPALCLLSMIENIRARWTNIVMVYGRVPFFYYFLHFLVIHLVCVVLFFTSGHVFSEAYTGMMGFRPDQFGYPLGVVYILWIVIVAALYPACKWYSDYKAAHTQWWLSYL